MINTVKALHKLGFLLSPIALTVLDTRGLLGRTSHRAVVLNRLYIQIIMMRTQFYGIGGQVRMIFQHNSLLYSTADNLKCLVLKSSLPFKALLFGGIDVCALGRKNTGKNQFSVFPFTENPHCFPSINSPESLELSITLDCNGFNGVLSTFGPVTIKPFHVFAKPPSERLLLLGGCQ